MTPRQRLSFLALAGWGLPLLATIATSVVILNGHPGEDTRRTARARDDIRALTAALIMPREDGNRMPTTAEGLAALVEAGAIPRLPDDPWGRPYQFRNPGTASAFELFSLGPDGVESRDDIVSWNLYGGRS